MDLMDELLEKVHDRVTRIDIACDIQTDVTPPQFVEKISSKRMSASGHQASKTGETCYVGSQKSERYARVYRYNKPHPRHELLRVEHVFRKDYAKQVAWLCATHGVDSIAASAGKAFGWGHPIWQPGVLDAPAIKIVSAERNAGKSVSWLVNQVAPAFKRLVAEGIIVNPDEFIYRYFLSESGEDSKPEVN